MRTQPRLRWLLQTTLVALLTAMPPIASADPGDQAAGDGYESGTYGRVRFAENGLTLRRAASDGAPHDGPLTNAPVFPGDTVESDGAQRAEIELAGATLIRLAEDTAVTFLALPDPYADIADNTVLQLHRGSIRFASLLTEDQELRLDTPAASVYPLGNADLRVDVAEDGTTFVTSFRGVVEVAGSGGSVVVRGGTRARVLPGDYPEDAVAFHTLSRDGFDRWVAGREPEYAPQDRHDVAYDELPQEVRPYYRELSTHGRWVWIEDQGYAWTPRYVGSTWRPYHDGYWSYGPSGYFWVSSEPWGWAPYRYGRWSWTGAYGWCWVPGRVFAGAWVAWSWGSIHVGWAPLGYWNQPVYVGGVYHGYYDPACWTFVSYTHVDHHYGYGRYAVPLDDVDVRSHVVVSRAPGVPPGRLARSSDARAQALREARAATAGRVRAIDRTVRPGETMRDLERRQVAQRGARATDPDQGAIASRRSNGRGEEPGSGAGASRFPRRITSAVGRPHAGTVPGVRSNRAIGPAEPRTVVRDADGRVRDLYRRMASPRTTRDDSTAPSAGPIEAPRADRSARPVAPGTVPAPRSVAPRTTAGRQSSPPARPRESADRERGESGSRAPARPPTASPAPPRPSPARSAPTTRARPAPSPREFAASSRTSEPRGPRPPGESARSAPAPRRASGDPGPSRDSTRDAGADRSRRKDDVRPAGDSKRERKDAD